MVEVDGKRAGILSLARPLNYLKKRRRLFRSAKELDERTPYTYERVASPQWGRVSHTQLSLSSFSLEAEVRPKPICPLCRHLGQEVWDPEYRDKHGIGELSRHLMPAQDVYRAAAQGCSGCEIIAWVLEPYMAQIEGQGKTVRLYFEKSYFNILGARESHILEFYGSELSIDSVLATIEIKSTPYWMIEGAFPRSDYRCPWRYLKSTAPIAEHTGSSIAVKKVQTWYSECLSSHKRCLQDSSSKLPTRIIRIDGPNKAILHIPDAEHAHYACLSHCWGDQAVIQTTSRTLDQYTADIPWQKLPKTFQDAIQFAYGLGFKYLWIDSLCIIQDSIDDWRHEGSQMSQIYANASITLSATWAENSSKGCFVTPQQQYTSRKRKFTNSDHETYELHCHETLPQLQTPLQKRGWVFQERMLSRRIVHFMEQELWWECRECFDCECQSMEHKRPREIQMILADLLNEQGLAERRWQRIVQAYTSKLLTYPGDIFPAIQALAKLVSPTMGRYLAGHWENTLISSLPWYVEKPVLDKHKEWRAPSWSWAAAQGQVYWNEQHMNSLHDRCATVVNAMTIPKGDDPMGQISYGSIVLRGKYLTGQVQERERPSNPGLELKGNSVDRLPGCSIKWDNLWQCVAGKEVIALRIFEAEFLTGLDFGTSNQYWLILETVEGTKGEYMRIGMMVSQALCTKALRALYDKEAGEMDFKII